MNNRINSVAMRLAGIKPIVRTAGRVEFVKDTGPIRRDIRVKDFEWTSESLQNLAKILWAAQRAHSYAISAYRLFSKMPSAQFSPDGMLGGRGYIQNVKDMRNGLSQAVEVLSAFTDTIHDEVNADHWADIDDSTSIKPMVDDIDQIKENPEDFIEGEFDQVTSEEFDDIDGLELDESELDPDEDSEDEDSEESGSSWDEEDLDGEDSEDDSEDEEEDLENPDADELNHLIDKDDSDDSGDSSFSQMAANVAKKMKVSEAKLPSDDSEQKLGKTEVEMTMHTVSPDHGSYASAITRVMKAQEARVASIKLAGGDSAIPQSDLSGPRVEHVGPGETEEGWASDDPMGNNLGGGVNTSVPVYEDWCADGISGYEDPTSGDSSVLQISSRLAAGYSWLPGADNNKLMPYYTLGISDEEEEWMRTHNQPDMPAGIGPQKPAKPRSDPYWNSLLFGR